MEAEAIANGQEARATHGPRGAKEPRQELQELVALLQEASLREDQRGEREMQLLREREREMEREKDLSRRREGREALLLEKMNMLEEKLGASCCA